MTRPIAEQHETGAHRLLILSRIVREFGLESLQTGVSACEGLVQEQVVDVAVFGQFKSGKSSFLNVLLTEPLFPVGVLPVTAVVTRAVGGPMLQARITHLDGTNEEVDPARIAEFVTETNNPKNAKKVLVVDIITPVLEACRGIRFVDTPGIGSIFAHNTEATRTWLPNAAIALVTVSAERPLSEDDLALINDARQTAPRVYVVLTKVDVLSENERAEVQAFVQGALQSRFGEAMTVVPFSSKVDAQRYSRNLHDTVIKPVMVHQVEIRGAALNLKLSAIAAACRDYLTIALRSAERTDAERYRLRSAVFTESESASIVHDELRSAQQQVVAAIRPRITSRIFDSKSELTVRMTRELNAAARSWTGNLAQQSERYRQWVTAWLAKELNAVSNSSVALATEIIGQAEVRYRRIIEALQDRLMRNVREAIGVSFSPVAWEFEPPCMQIVPVSVGTPFMTPWELLWWLLPMAIIGRWFRRHVIRRAGWEVEKNLSRLVSDWTEVIEKAASNVRCQADAWVDRELETLSQMLDQRPNDSLRFQTGIEAIDGQEAFQVNHEQRRIIPQD